MCEDTSAQREKLTLKNIKNQNPHCQRPPLRPSQQHIRPGADAELRRRNHTCITPEKGRQGRYKAFASVCFWPITAFRHWPLWVVSCPPRRAAMGRLQPLTTGRYRTITDIYSRDRFAAHHREAPLPQGKTEDWRGNQKRGMLPPITSES